MKRLFRPLKILIMNSAMGFVNFLGKLQRKLTPPQPFLLNIAIGDIVLNRSLYVATELGIADLLKNGAKSIDYLAEETGADADTLYRIMRMLASEGIFKAKKNKNFETNKLGRHLQSDVEDSMCDFIRAAGADWANDIWDGIIQTTKTGKDYYENRYGINFFDWLKKHKEAQKLFDIAMTSVSSLSKIPITNAYDFSNFDTIVDVGGGHGSQIVSILKTYPETKGILFDLPFAIEALKKDDSFEGRDLDGRLECVGGDFFESVPAGGDAYLVKFILRDWNDEHAEKILKNCRKAMHENSTMLIVENIVKDDVNEPDFGKVLDVSVMAMMGGRVRTRTEYSQLLEKTGFKLIRTLPTASPFSILEAKPI